MNVMEIIIFIVFVLVGIIGTTIILDICNIGNDSLTLDKVNKSTVFLKVDEKYSYMAVGDYRNYGYPAIISDGQVYYIYNSTFFGGIKEGDTYKFDVTPSVDTKYMWITWVYYENNS